MNSDSLKALAVGVQLLVSGLVPVLVSADSVSGRSDPTSLCFEPERSIIWKTVPADGADVSLAWPYSAVRAVLTVKDGAKVVSTVEVADRSADSIRLPLSLPEQAADERVLALRLDWYDSDGNLLSWAAQTAKIGLVCGGTTAEGLLGDSFGKCVRTAVVPVPEGTLSLSVDGEAQEFDETPDWCCIRPKTSGRHMVARVFAGGSESGPIDFAFPGLLLLFR